MLTVKKQHFNMLFLFDQKFCNIYIFFQILRWIKHDVFK